MTEVTTLIPKLILVLLLGGGGGAPDPDKAGVLDVHQQEIPVSATLRLNRLRAFVAKEPELQKLLYGDTAPAAAREQAAIQLGQFIGVEAGTLKEVAGRIQTLEVQLLGFGEREHQLRVLAAIQKSPGQPLLPALLDKWAGAVDEYDYQGQIIHFIADRRGMGVWFVEQEKAILLGTDPLLIESSLLKTAQAGPGTDPTDAGAAEKKDALLSLRIDPQVFLGQVLHSIGRHDRDEFLAVSSMFDLAALQKMTVTYDGKRLHAKARLAPGSTLSTLLAPPAEGPAALSVLPDNVGLALVAGVKDPKAIWTHIGKVIERIEGMGRRDANRRGEMDEIRQHFQERYGLSLDKDLFGNLQSAAYVVSRLRTGRDLERNMAFLLSAKDAGSSRTTLGNFMKGIHRNDPGVAGVQEGEALVWRSPQLLAASCKNQVLIANPRGEGFDELLKSVAGPKGSLAATLQKRFPGASLYGVLDLGGFLPEDAGKDTRLFAGLRLKNDQLDLAIDGNLPTLLAPVVAAVGNARNAARKTMSLNNLKQIALACMMYAEEHDGKLPADVNGLGKYIGNAPRLLRCPISGQPYVYNKAVAGKKLQEVGDPGRTPLAYSQVAPNVDGGAIAYIDGHVRWFSREQGYEEMIRKLKQAKPAPAPAEKDGGEEEVF